MVGTRATQEVLAFCQPEEVLFSSRIDSVLWLYGIFIGKYFCPDQVDLGDQIYRSHGLHVP